MLTQNSNNRLRWVAVVVVVLIATLLTACGAPTTTPIPPTSVPPTAIPEPPTPIPTMTADAAEKTTQTQKASPTPWPADKPKVEMQEITSEALAKNLVGDPATRNYWVYLPAGYDTKKNDILSYTCSIGTLATN